MPHYYCVLDYFQITDFWWEKIPAKVKEVQQAMVRLEKVDLATRSWFAPKGASREEAREFDVGEYACKTITCGTCNTPSKEKFNWGWACLNKDCEKFFEFALKTNTPLLEYNENFLRERTSYTPTNPEQDARLDSLIPPLPELDDTSLGCEEKYKGGIVCPRCHRCNNRVEWGGWVCESPGCEFRLPMPLRMVPTENILKENNKFKDSRYHHETIRKQVFKNDHYEAAVYILPGEHPNEYAGSVTDFKLNDKAIERDGGINDLYQRMQREDMPLKRRAAKNAGQRIEELTSHFSTNFVSCKTKPLLLVITNNAIGRPIQVRRGCQGFGWVSQCSKAGDGDAAPAHMGWTGGCSVDARDIGGPERQPNARRCNSQGV